MSDDEDSDPDPEVTIVWSIGRKSKNYRGIGICRYEKTKIKVYKVEVDLSKLRKSNTAYSNIHKIDFDTIRISFDPVSRKYINEVFGGDKIVLEKETTFGLDIAITFTTKAGPYPIKYNPDTEEYDFIFINDNK